LSATDSPSHSLLEFSIRNSLSSFSQKIYILSVLFYDKHSAFAWIKSPKDFYYADGPFTLSDQAHPEMISFYSNNFYLNKAQPWIWAQDTKILKSVHNEQKINSKTKTLPTIKTHSTPSSKLKIKSSN
jgi:hypothetical protein